MKGTIALRGPAFVPRTEPAAAANRPLSSPAPAQVFAEEGAAEATGESAVQDRQAVLRAAVRRHVGEVNEQFLGVLNQYISSAMEADQPQTVRILMGVREEVLAVVGDSLPAEVQVVDLLTTVPTVELMDKVLAIANGGGGTVSGSLRVPASSMEKVRGGRSPAGGCSHLSLRRRCREKRGGLTPKGSPNEGVTRAAADARRRCTAPRRASSSRWRTRMQRHARQLSRWRSRALFFFAGAKLTGGT